MTKFLNCLIIMMWIFFICWWRNWRWRWIFINFPLMTLNIQQTYSIWTKLSRNCTSFQAPQFTTIARGAIYNLVDEVKPTKLYVSSSHSREQHEIQSNQNNNVIIAYNYYQNVSFIAQVLTNHLPEIYFFPIILQKILLLWFIISYFLANNYNDTVNAASETAVILYVCGARIRMCTNQLSNGKHRIKRTRAYNKVKQQRRKQNET